jgi:hypothetical protein
LVWLDPDIFDGSALLREADTPLQPLNSASYVASAGEIAIHVDDACGAPGGTQAWISDVVASVGAEPRFSPFERMSEVEAWILDVDESEWRPWKWRVRWRTRVAWVRYNFLLRHIPARPQRVKGTPPDNPKLRAAWEAREKAYQAYKRAARRYTAATEAYYQEQGGSPASVQRKRGRIGNTALREAVAALMPLYSEMFGVEPTITHGGPAVRFVSKVLKEVEKPWLLHKAADFEPDGYGRILLIAERVPALPAVRADAVRDTIRFVKAAKEPHLRAVGTEEGIPVTRFFVPEQEEGEEWWQDKHQMPPLFRLPLREITL